MSSLNFATVTLVLWMGTLTTPVAVSGHRLLLLGAMVLLMLGNRIGQSIAPGQMETGRQRLHLTPGARHLLAYSFYLFSVYLAALANPACMLWAIPLVVFSALHSRSPQTALAAFYLGTGVYCAAMVGVALAGHPQPLLWPGLPVALLITGTEWFDREATGTMPPRPNHLYAAIALVVAAVVALWLLIYQALSARNGWTFAVSLPLLLLLTSRLRPLAKEFSAEAYEPLRPWVHAAPLLGCALVALAAQQQALSIAVALFFLCVVLWLRLRDSADPPQRLT